MQSFDIYTIVIREKEKKKQNVEERKESFVSVSPEMMYAFAFALWKLSYNGIMADSEKIIIKVEPMPQIDWFVDLPKNQLDWLLLEWDGIIPKYEPIWKPWIKYQVMRMWNGWILLWWCIHHGDLSEIPNYI